MGADAAVSPLARLFESLDREKIRILIAGMSAAVLQGVPYTTLDTDVWVALPPRQYIRVLNLCRTLGAMIAANTVVILSDGTTVNFLYRMDGLRSFPAEFRNALRMDWQGRIVRVLPLERIVASKRAVGRPKDIAHLPILAKSIECRDC